MGDSITVISRAPDYLTMARRRQSRRPAPTHAPRWTAPPFSPSTVLRPHPQAVTRLLPGRHSGSLHLRLPIYHPSRRRYPPVHLPLARPPAPGLAPPLLATSQPEVPEAASRPVETTRPTTSLHDEFRRLRRDQTRWTRRFRPRSLHSPLTPRQRLRRRVLLALPLVLLATVGVILVPLLYQGARAYQQIFVEPVERVDLPILPAINPQGTPVFTGPDPKPSGAAAAPETWDAIERLTLLLLGIDRRENEPSRSDTMILVSVDPVVRTAAMLSIPRDLQLVVPGFGLQKMNAAYAFGEANDLPGGGAALAMQTVEANFGIRIDYFAEVDFQGFTKVVDIVGGLTLDVPYPIKDDQYPNGIGNQYTRLYFSAGWQHMDGARALQYARTRNDDGDFSRARRQQQVLLALQDKAADLDLLLKADEMMVTLGDSVRTDLSPSQAIRLARLGSEIPRDQISQHSLLPALSVAEEDGPYYLVPDWAAVGDILSDFTGTPVTPPAAALALADHDVPIRIENGTANPGLAARVTDLLLSNGFTDVTYAPAADPGSHPRTTVIDTAGNVATAALVANLVGFGPDRIDDRSLPARLATPSGASSARSTLVNSSADPDSPGIVVLLGDDAPDPAGIIESSSAESTSMPAPSADDADPIGIETDISPTDGGVPANEGPAAVDESELGDAIGEPEQDLPAEVDQHGSDSSG